MKKGIYSILKAKYLVDEDAAKNWRFVVFLIFLSIVMIANTHRFEQKVFKIAALTSEVKELRTEFVEKKSQLMKLRMESTISAKMEERKIFPAETPPVKIKVKKVEEKSFFKKLWQ